MLWCCALESPIISFLLNKLSNTVSLFLWVRNLGYSLAVCLRLKISHEMGRRKPVFKFTHKTGTGLWSLLHKATPASVSWDQQPKGMQGRSQSSCHPITSSVFSSLEVGRSILCLRNRVLQQSINVGKQGSQDVILGAERHAPGKHSLPGKNFSTFYFCIPDYSQWYT